MATTVHQLIQQLKKLDPNKRFSLCGESHELYLYQQTDSKGEMQYTLDHGDFTRDGHGAILLHDFQGLEQPTKKWAYAIAKRIFEETDSLVDYCEEIEDTTLLDLLLKDDGKPHARTKIAVLLMLNVHYIYQLIGTTVIEEGFFDSLD
jgi:hypothetical protein